MGKYTSVFTQMLQIIPRYEIQKAVKRHGAERHSKGFSSWTQFVALLFCQIAGHDGLCGVVTGPSRGAKIFIRAIGRQRNDMI